MGACLSSIDIEIWLSSPLSGHSTRPGVALTIDTIAQLNHVWIRGDSEEKTVELNPLDYIAATVSLSFEWTHHDHELIVLHSIERSERWTWRLNGALPNWTCSKPSLAIYLSPQVSFSTFPFG